MKSTQCRKNNKQNQIKLTCWYSLEISSPYKPHCLTQMTMQHVVNVCSTLIEMFLLKLLQCVWSLLAIVPFWGRPHYTWKRHMEHTSAVSPGCWRARKCDSVSFAPSPAAAAAPRRGFNTLHSLFTRMAAHTRLSRSIFFPHQSNTLPNDFLSQTWDTRTYIVSNSAVTSCDPSFSLLLKQIPLPSLSCPL